MPEFARKPARGPRFRRDDRSLCIRGAQGASGRWRVATLLARIGADPARRPRSSLVRGRNRPRRASCRPACPATPPRPTRSRTSPTPRETGPGRPEAEGHLRRQQLGGHGRRHLDQGRRVQDAHPHQHRPRLRRARRRDLREPGRPRLLPGDPRARRRGQRPARRRHVLDARRQAPGRLAPKLPRRRCAPSRRSRHRRDQVALPGRRPALRPHGGLARRQAGRGFGLDRKRRPPPRHRRPATRKASSPRATRHTRTPTRRTARRSTTRRSASSTRQATTPSSTRTPTRASASSRSSTPRPARSSRGSTWATSSRRRAIRT